jgi:hypothetical protein
VDLLEDSVESVWCVMGLGKNVRPPCLRYSRLDIVVVVLRVFVIFG